MRGGALRLGQIVERDALVRSPALGTHPRGGTKIDAERRVQRNKIEREQHEQRIEDIRPRRGKHGADGIGDEPEQHAAARTRRGALPRRRPAGVHIPAEAEGEIPLRGRRLHDKKDCGKQKVHAGDPARGDGLFAEHEDDGDVQQQDKQRVDEKAREPDKERRDRDADLAEYDTARRTDKEHDGAEKKQRHADRLPREERAHTLILFVFSASDSVQNNLRHAAEAAVVSATAPVSKRV